MAADDVRRGRPPVRIRQARHTLRARARGRDGGYARFAVRRLRAGRGGAVPARAADVLARRTRRARGDREGAGREGARVPRARRGRRAPVTDREIPLRGRARGARTGSRRDAPLRSGHAGGHLAGPRASPPAPGAGARADRRRGVHIPLGHGLPDVRLGRRGGPLGRNPPSVHPAHRRLARPVRRRPGTRARVRRTTSS